MLRDMRHAIRLLLKNPGYTFIAVLTMALGIGANTTVFSVVNAILLRPLPGIADPGRLFSVSRLQDGNVFDSFGYPDYSDFRDRGRSFVGLAAYCTAPLSMTTDGTSRVHGNLVTENYFDVLGAKPAVGRLLVPGDGDVAVVSYAMWHQRLGGRPIGEGMASIVLNGVPFTIVGVAEPGFRGTAVAETIDVWVPLSTQPVTLSRMSAGILQNRASGWLQVFGRLRPGATARQADAELRTIAAQLGAAYPQTNRNRSVSVAGGVGMYPDDRAEVTGLLALLEASVGLLLLIACANVAGLFMVRAARRSREMAVRLAVGAGRWRLIRQLLAEGIVLAFAAGAVAILAAQWLAVEVGQVSASASLLHRVDIEVDGRVLVFTFAACLLTGLLFAIVPAIQSSQVDVASALKNGSAGAGMRRSRFKATLVISQVGLSFLLIAASAAIVRDLHRLVTGNPGFETKRVAMISVDMSTLPNFEDRGRAFYRQVLERLPAVPGVASVTLAATVPPQDFSGRISVFYPGQEPTPEVLRGREFELGLRVDMDRIAPGYFRTLGIPLVRGRDFTNRDHGVVIISKGLADHLWPGEDAVGKRIAWPEPGGVVRPPFEVIGVAADTKYRSLIAEAPLLLYAPVLSEYDSRTHIVVRTASVAGASEILADVERVVRNIDKDVPIYHPETMEGHTADSLWQQRTAASWIGAFSMLALILAAVGLYGVIAQSVAQRTRELGIRMALGAAPASVSRLVMREGMVLAIAGIAVGVPAALGSDRIMRGMLEGIGAMDSGILFGVGCLLAAVTAVASWIPARRAARVDPLIALRQD